MSGTLNLPANGLAVGTNQLVVNGGNVGIGTAGPAYKLHVAGDAAGTSWTNLSSRDYKRDIQPVNSARQQEMLRTLLDARLTTYRYKTEVGGEDRVRIGFIAEELPREVLSKDGKGVDVYELLGYSIAAIKAQQADIEAQEAEIEALRSALKGLRK